MFQHKRAQTANPVLKAKHQDTILREIKATQGLDHSFKKKHRQPRCTDPNPNLSPSPSLIPKSPFACRIREIERLNARSSKHAFSFEKDERKICEVGWNDFQEKIERSTHQHLVRVRKKAKELRKQASVSIFTCGGGQREREESEVGEERIADLWGMVKGEHPVKMDQFIRVDDLARDIKSSYVLKNAYIACLNSKKYRESPQASFTAQKLKSFVFLQQNEAKLSKNRLNDLLKNNYFLQ